MLSSGARIPLRLESAITVKGAVQGSGGCGLFPGQIVAVQGRNGSGEYFHASTILAVRSFEAVFILVSFLRDLVVETDSSAETIADESRSTGSQGRPIARGKRLLCVHRLWPVHT